MVLPSGAEVLRGEEGLRVGVAMLGRAQRLLALLTASVLEEFAPLLLDELRDLRDRGGSVRVLSVGAPPREVLDLLAHVGANVRVLRTPRESGFLATNEELLLFTSQPTEAALLGCAVHVDDLLAVAHFSLAFEQAWEAAG